MQTGAPKATITLIDLTTTVPSFQGVNCGVLVPSNFGSIEGDGILEVSDESDYLTQLTSRGNLEIGAPLQAFSSVTYLKQGNNLRVKRILGDNYKYGGARVMATGSESEVSVSTGSILLANADLYSITDGQPVLYTVSEDGTAFAGLTANTIYYMRRKTSPATVDLFLTQAAAIANTSPIALTTDDGTHTLKLLNTQFFNTVTTSVFTLSAGDASCTNVALYNAVINGSAVVYSRTGGSNPAGLVAGTTYYVKKGSTPVLTLYPTQEDALANTSPITIGTLSGSNSLTFTLEAGLNKSFAKS